MPGVDDASGGPPVHIFICLENPQSWLGNKTKNLGAKPPSTQKSFEEKTRQASLRATRHEPFPHGIHDPSSERDHAGVRTLMKDLSFLQPGSTMGVAASGSLPSMTKRLVQHQATLGGGKIDTIVFIGHANEDSMSVGTGQYGFNSEKAEKVFQYKKREISMSNVTSWGPTFSSIAGSVDANDNGCVNVFLLGCNSGSGALLREVAAQLKVIFNQEVVVYGFNAECDWQDTLHVLRNIETIVEDAAPFENKTGSIPVHDNINLVFASSA